MENSFDNHSQCLNAKHSNESIEIINFVMKYIGNRRHITSHLSRQRFTSSPTFSCRHDGGLKVYSTPTPRCITLLVSRSSAQSVFLRSTRALPLLLYTCFRLTLARGEKGGYGGGRAGQGFPKKYEFNKEEGVMYGPVPAEGGTRARSAGFDTPRYCIRNISYAAEGELYKGPRAAADAVGKSKK